MSDSARLTLPDDVRVFLVRHGEVENPRGVVYGALPGFGLSVRGRDQATAAARELATRISNGATMLTSPLQRAVETADVIAAALGQTTARTTHPGLTESGTLREGLPRRFGPHRTLGRLLAAEHRARVESPRVVLARVIAAIRDTVATMAHRDLVIVSHQIPIGLATVAFEHSHVFARALPRLFARRPCEPASITMLAWPERQLAISYWQP